MFSTNALFGAATSSSSPEVQKLQSLLVDEAVMTLSSLELNQIASLTYDQSTNDLGEQILELLQSLLAKPASYSPLSLEKALVVAQHVLIFGADMVVQEARVMLGKHVETLLQYNTVLLQQQQASASSVLFRIKGGGVDKGFSVREKAASVYKLLSNPEALRYERSTQADPNSLVPVGNEKAVFVTDELRLYALKKKMQEQQLMQTKSNLTKADNGFGGGYNSKDGKAVVGAAHGIEEMIQMAQREKKKFTDSGTATADVVNDTTAPSSFSDYQAPQLDVDPTVSSSSNDNAATTEDLLSLDAPSPAQHAAAAAAASSTANATQDLLDFSAPASATTTAAAVASADLLSGMTTTTTAAASSTMSSNHQQLLSLDPIANTAAKETTTASTTVAWATTADLLGTMSLQSGAAAPPATAAAISTSVESSNNELLSPSTTNDTLQQQTSSQKKPPIMGVGLSSSSSNQEDRFAALDALSDNVVPGVGGSSLLMETAGIGTSHIGSSSFAAAGSIGGGGSNKGGHQFSDLTSLAMGQVQPQQQAPPQQSFQMMDPNLYASSSSLKVSEQQAAVGSYYTTTDVNNKNNNNDDENGGGFVMGGVAGTGLQPVGQAPAAPPPPPPPPTYY